MLRLSDYLTNRLNYFNGATNTTAGSSGIVPPPNAGDNLKYLRGDGIWASLPATLVTVPIVTSSYNASVNTEIPVDVSNNSVTITLPSTASHSDKIRIVHVNGNISLNKIYVDPNSNIINGYSSMIEIDFPNCVFEITYYSPVNWWIITYSNY